MSGNKWLVCLHGVGRRGDMAYNGEAKLGIATVMRTSHLSQNEVATTAGAWSWGQLVGYPQRTLILKARLSPEAKKPPNGAIREANTAITSTCRRTGGKDTVVALIPSCS